MISPLSHIRFLPGWWFPPSLSGTSEAFPPRTLSFLNPFALGPARHPQNIRPHNWYLVVSHCSTNNTPPKHMRIEVRRMLSKRTCASTVAGLPTAVVDAR